ncbi:MAG: hypothetical protein JXI43_10815 [Tissierellales bacterium]|nr:hypothetical protein [Tissierellales bacterium]
MYHEPGALVRLFENGTLFCGTLQEVDFRGFSGHEEFFDIERDPETNRSTAKKYMKQTDSKIEVECDCGCGQRFLKWKSESYGLNFINRFHWRAWRVGKTHTGKPAKSSKYVFIVRQNEVELKIKRNTVQPYKVNMIGAR